MKVWKKQKDYYTLNDFLQDESFIDWVLSGRPSNSMWSDHLKCNDDLAKIAEEASAIITPLKGVNSDRIPSARIESIKRKIDDEIVQLNKVKALLPQEDFSRGSKKRKFLHTLPWWIAASIVLPFLFTLILYYDSTKQEPTILDELKTETRETKKGQKLTVYLNDGSKVKLNADSKITFHNPFSDTARIVYLTGEAFFEVDEDTLRPFKVISSHATVEVMGTSFNVNTSEAKSKVALVSGKLQVRSKDTQAILSPGQKIEADKYHLGQVSQIDYDEDLAWKDDILVFKNASMDEVIKRLEAWYGVSFTIHLNQDKRHWNYSGKFTNQSLHHVLMGIGLSEKFDFEIENKTIVLKPLTYEK